MTTAAVARGPIPIYTSSGQQRFVPLSALSFDASGVLQVAAAYASATGWLRYLAATGVITKGTAPPETPAMDIRAKIPGSWGNGVKVEIDYGASTTTYTLKVTATHRYQVTTATLGATLGTATITGSTPGLLRIKDADITGGLVGMPAAYPKTALGGTFTVAIPKQGGGTAFNLDAVSAATPADKIDITVTPGTGTSFTIDVALTVSATGVTSATLASAINSAVGYLAQVAPPAGATALGMPKAGTIFLSGGVDVATASASPNT